MNELKAAFKDHDVVEITHGVSDASWIFYVMTDRFGRRHLGGPHGSSGAMAHGHLLQQACMFAHSEALHAGKVDY